jgi:DNA-binding NarL/FixJ family response regulator
MDQKEGKISVVIADDHPIFRQGLRQVIEADARIIIVGEAADGDTALEQLESLSPDVAVLDIDMPGRDGFALAQIVKDKGLSTQVIFLTMYKEEDLFDRAVDLGVKGYVLKDSAATEIVESIRVVATGKHYISPAISSYLVNRNRRRDALAQHKPGLNDLTPTERRVLQLIAEEQTTREIAGRLFISPRTVDTHRANICRKLDLHGSLALVKFAIEHKSEL